jgi:hypothetical protein
MTVRARLSPDAAVLAPALAADLEQCHHRRSATDLICPIRQPRAAYGPAGAKVGSQGRCQVGMVWSE